MAIRTVIMAGGQGVRLRPLTQYCPKPLAPLCAEAVMGYTLRLLHRHGIDAAHAALYYRPQDVMREFGAGRHGVRLTYSVEDTPLGTAGSVLKAIGRGTDTVLVLSGDGLTGCDLTAALAFHRRRGAMATLVLAQVENPLPYGVVVAAPDGRIRCFIEKPDWTRAIGSCVNTGIYLLEPEALALIPENEPYDFGRQLFPRMLEMGLPLFGYRSDEYWCDVGDPAAFLRAQADLLQNCTGFLPSDYGIRSLKDGYISFDSYVSPAARPAPDAVIENSCILPGAVIDRGARISGSIIGAGAYVGKGAVVKAGSVLGNGARMGDFSCCEGGRVFAGVACRAGAVIRTPVLQAEDMLHLHQGSVRIHDPQQIVRLAGALMQTVGGKCFAVQHAPNGDTAAALWAGALAAYGAQSVQMLGCGPEGMLSFAMTQDKMDAGIWADAQTAKIYAADGRMLSQAQSMAVLAAYDRCEMPAPSITAAPIVTKSVRAAYLQWLRQQFGVCRGVEICVEGQTEEDCALISEALKLCGHRVIKDAACSIHAADGTLCLREERLPSGEEKRWLLCAALWHSEGRMVYDLTGALPAVPWLLPYENSAACCEQERIRQDPLAMTLLLLKACAQPSLPPLPALERRSMLISCAPGEKGRLLEAFIPEALPSLRGGLQLIKAGAQAHIMPDPILPSLRITACACSAENAQELCDVCSGTVRDAMRPKEKTDSRISGSSA